MNKLAAVSTGVIPSVLLSVGMLSSAAHAEVSYKSKKLPDAPNSIVALNNATQLLTMRDNNGMKEVVIEDWSNNGSNYAEIRPAIPITSTTRVTAFNDSLQIVGYDTGSVRAFAYSDGVLRYIDDQGPPLRASGGDVPHTRGTGINNSGRAVGEFANRYNPWTAFFYSASDSHFLGPIGGFASGVPDQTAVGINNLGQVTGTYKASDSLLHTYFNDQYVVTDLGSNLFPVDINDRSEVFGQAFLGSHSKLCFIYRNGQTIHLGALGIASSITCEPSQINNAGIAVGFVYGSGGPVDASGPFAYMDGQMLDLNKLLSASDYLRVNNIKLNNALFINDKNEIIATAANAAGVNEYYLLTPITGGTDSAYYNFETDAQGWVSSGEPIITVSTSATQKFAGNQSLAIQLNGSGYAAVRVSNPAAHAGEQLTFHLYIPADAHIDWVQPFVQEGAAGNWGWHSNWTPTSALQAGAWNTITVDVPSNVTAIDSIGIELFVAQGGGTVFLDSVGPATTTNPDPAQYNFESGLQSWQSSDSSALVSTSPAQHFAGANSLAIKFNNATFAAVNVLSPTAHAGQTITFHVYLPADAPISALQPYAQEDAAGNWAWHASWTGGDGLQLGAWNTITLALPSDAQALREIGLQISTQQNYNGTIYLDSVSY